MKKTAIVDRFEGDYVVLESENEGMINIPRANAPAMLGEGMVVYYEDDRILSIDYIETDRRETEMRRRFERLLGKSDSF